MRVYVLGSGSTGNCAIVESDGARVVLDAGMNPTAAGRALRALGTDVVDRGVETVGIVVSHHHGDHIAELLPLARALRVPVYLHAGIVATKARARTEVRPYVPGAAFDVGPFVVETVAVPHDAPQVAIRVDDGVSRFGLATDLGHAPRWLPQFLGDCDGALVEANFCPELLAVGPYPPRVQDRVRGPFGHLANEQTAELARAMQARRIARLWLGHLSRSNNTPDRAIAAVAPRCRTLPVDVIPHGTPRALEVPRGRAHQLALPFGR
jgi:phosphoribosyl 1,2-cyclic phosphodiesterase